MVLLTYIYLYISVCAHVVPVRPDVFVDAANLIAIWLHIDRILSEIGGTNVCCVLVYYESYLLIS